MSQSLNLYLQITSTTSASITSKLQTYLGGSNLIANNSDMDFFLKHGAMSSSNKSPWQPVSVATFFFIANGSRCRAHGDSAEPLIKIARCIKSGNFTEKRRVKWIWEHKKGEWIKKIKYKHTQCVCLIWCMYVCIFGIQQKVTADFRSCDKSERKLDLVGRSHKKLIKFFYL